MGHEFQIEVDEVHMFAGETWHDLGEKCDHDCRHLGQTVVAWGPDIQHYELNHCDQCACRSWLDGRHYIERQRDPAAAKFWAEQSVWRKRRVAA